MLFLLYVIESVESFSVFRPARKAGSKIEEAEVTVDVASQRKKELNKRMEVGMLVTTVISDVIVV